MPPGFPRTRCARRWLALRRWLPFGIVGLALLAASQMLWRWQTWTVRALLDAL